ncbi:MAG: HAMP domain-containing histidine kinase [Acidimicrobiia bacterium]|nr:HAMP domain-containing histidine kinase [Acidimicrobiia bacterium]
MSRLRTVRVRVTLAAAGLFAVALALASFGLVRSVHDNLVDEIKQTNEQQLEAVALQLERGVNPEDVQVPGGGPGGTPLLQARGPGGRPVNLPGADGRPQVRPGENPQVRAQRQVETAQGTVTLVAENSLDAVDSTVDSITGALVIGVPVLIALLAGLTWWLTGRALRPVEAIRAEAAAITGSTIHRRVPEPNTDDEVGRLARTMNSMLDRLEATSLRQRRFVSDASHELRSPIAVIRAQLEVALRRGDGTDWPTIAQRVLVEDARLEQAVGELLELARTEERVDATPVVVDLDEVVLEETARERRVPVDTSRVLAGRVHGTSAQLARVVANLLDNACRHAKTHVAVALGRQEHDVVLTVDDDGPGISVADRERVFERFTRLDEGRSRDAGGVGLGLAMVQAIVERHGGSVSVDDAPLGGARFVVRLPATD